MLAERSTPGSATKTSRLTLQRPDGYRPRLLLAEDSDPVRIVTAAMLKGMGCDVDAVVHGEDAVKSASANRFDVIVLDIEMPVMDGITAARSIRRLGGPTYQTPIMALSAFLADAMQSASWGDTFDIALPKPANRNELHAAVKAALERSSRQISVERLLSEPLICSAQQAELKAGLSPEVWKGLVKIACRDIEDCLARIEDSSRLVTYARKLKALGRTFAAPRLAMVAGRLEQAMTTCETAELVEMLAATGAATVAALTSI